MRVYLLTHTRDEEDLDGFKIIGIFSSQEKALEAARSLSGKQGFRDYPDKFNVGGYDIDKMFWVDGFG